MTFAKKSITAGILSATLIASSLLHASEQDGVDLDTRHAALVAELNQSGSALYAARDYRRAVEKFLQAHAIDPDPNLLFNIARCYHAIGDATAAIEKYRQFVASPGADPDGKRRAQEALDTLLQEQERAASSQPLSAPTPAPVGSHPRPAPLPPRPADNSRSLGVLPWITLAAGGTASIVGAVVYAGGVSDHQRVTGAEGFGQPNAVVAMTEVQAQALVDSGNSKKTLGGITLGAGGALLATSVILFIVDGNSTDTPEEPVAVAAIPLRSGGSVSISGRF